MPPFESAGPRPPPLGWCRQSSNHIISSPRLGRRVSWIVPKFGFLSLFSLQKTPCFLKCPPSALCFCWGCCPPTVLTTLPRQPFCRTPSASPSWQRYPNVNATPSALWSAGPLQTSPQPTCPLPPVMPSFFRPFPDRSGLPRAPSWNFPLTPLLI